MRLELVPYTIKGYESATLRRLSQAGENVYTDKRNIYFPVNVIPELFSPQRVTMINEACKKLGAKVDVGIYSTSINQEEVPIHACLEILYKEKRIIGPILISLSHTIVKHKDIEAQEKIAITTDSIQNLFTFADCVIIGMPQLKEGSFTHSIFSSEMLGATCFSDLENKTLYYFFEANLDSAKLLADPQFHAIYQTIYTLWLYRLKELKATLPTLQHDPDEYVAQYF